MSQQSREVTPITCPGCGITRNAVTPMSSEEGPRPGHAVLVCTHCAAVCLLQEDWTLRLLTDEERTAAFEADPMLKVAVDMLRFTIDAEREVAERQMRDQ